jgi:hypothetical protein
VDFSSPEVKPEIVFSVSLYVDDRAQTFQSSLRR